MARRTPLAWNNLTHDLRRLAVAAGGVAFAVLLIFMQLGYLNALLESTVQILRVVEGELVIVSSGKYTLPARERFDLQRVLQVEGVEGVERVAPLYMETLQAIVRRPGERGYPIRVFAFREDDELFRPAAIRDQMAILRQPDVALVDTASRAKYGFFSHGDITQFRGELSGRRLRLVGEFRLGVDFATEGNLLMTARNFARYFPMRAEGSDPLSQVDFAIVKLTDPRTRIRTREKLESLLPADVRVWDKEDLIQQEKDFWRTNAPVGYIFLVGVYVGFLVGVIICYQVLFADISDHMAEFATLKAMGYSGRYFLGVVVCQATYLTLLGFIPGALASKVIYWLLGEFTGLTMPLTLQIAMIVLLVTWVMCTLSALLVVRKLISLDPAELF
jgi:putative ABC transport system permease protein